MSDKKCYVCYFDYGEWSNYTMEIVCVFETKAEAQEWVSREQAQEAEHGRRRLEYNYNYTEVPYGMKLAGIEIKEGT